MRADEFYTNVFQLSDEGLIRRLAGKTRQKNVKKGEVIAQEGEVQSSVYFLVSGVLRGFFLDAKGRDITDCFAFQCGDPAVSCIKFGEPSFVSIEALTDCELFAIPVFDLMELVNDSPQLLRAYNGLLTNALRYHWSMKELMYQYTAMERYQWFLKYYPGLIERVSGKHVASLLGMTSVTLSRLKRAIREERAQKGLGLFSDPDGAEKSSEGRELEGGTE